MGAMVSFVSNGASATGYLAEPPAASSRGRGVIVIQEWWGLNDQIKRVADRFAAAGYAALTPDLYHGTLTKSPDQAGKLLMALNIARAEADLRGAVSHLGGRTARAVGVVGFCMGGALSLFAACTNPGAVAACVVYYGGHPKVDYDFDRLTAPVLGHWAENDGFAEPNRIRFEAELGRRGKPFEFYRYPGTQHAFFNDDRPEVYQREAAELSWQRTLAFFETHL